MPPIEWLQLPQEVLLHIFTFLSPTEKANVRATCTYLRTLVDHPSLWKNSIIVFKSIGIYNARFWDTLQNRKICSVEVSKVTLKQFKKMSSSLPDITNVRMDSCLKGEILQGLQPLLNLKQLQLSDCSNVTDHDLFTEIVFFQLLTHLSLCRVTFSSVLPLTSIVLLQNLYSLSLHSKEGIVPERALQYILFRLPKLRELSLAIGNMNKWKLSLCFNMPDNFVSAFEGAAPFEPLMCPISSKLENLSVVGTQISNAALAWFSKSASGLKCLNLNFSYGYDEDVVKKFPCLFPQLQKLYLSNTRLTEESLLVLANLYSLQVLDISNNLHLTPEAILAFRKITSNRIGLILERPIESVKYCCW
ncbi:uncharacterized protein LOC134583255 isoform X2 [Pelobates fuscus]|uniref:uncharacterized protein LOC134583255 isoform X2 n=1 Tax=Pelobates fuscus TaxID=191477 RepID=UPI002FE4991B